MKKRLGIDFGTTQIKAMAMSRGGRTESIETIPMPIQRSGRKVTHSPENVLEKVRSIPNRFRLDGEWEAAIACQRSTFILWDREDGSPLTPIISWRDRRAEEWVNNLSKDLFETIRSITGLRPEAGYPLAKIIWLRENNPKLEELLEKDRIRYGSLDTWLIWKATGEEKHVIDPTQASRTLLYDVNEQTWSARLLEKFNLPVSCFPEVQSSFRSPIDAGNLWENGEIINTIGDQPAATIGGQEPPYPQIRVTLGTAGFVAKTCEPEECPEPLTLTFTPGESGQIYQSEGVVLSAGRSIDWFTRILGINVDTMENFITPPWNENIPLWCPSLNGVGAPFWSDRDGSINLLRENTSTKSLSLGLLVSILMRIRDILEVLPESQQDRILLDGGLSRFRNLPQLASSIWDLPTAITLTPHLTCRGALVASHWVSNYFDADPWESLNLEVVIPERDIPRQKWINDWQNCLREWNLEVKQ